MKITGYAEYIEEARKRGFSDLAIRNSLLEKGWPLNEINLAFNYLQTMDIEKMKEDIKKHPSEKNKVVIYLDDEILFMLEKRAKKNMLTLPQQIEDVLRRSTLNQKGKKNTKSEKLDDNLVGLFSRKKQDQKRRKKIIQKRKKRRKLEGQKDIKEK
ncbi:MAG TPA: hypothetical protein PK357_01110 [Candidatus Pacearchaeota archaeon]|nr:hypothetical protein [Candidatus Pacearchaeota archaeon]